MKNDVLSRLSVLMGVLCCTACTVPDPEPESGISVSTSSGVVRAESGPERSLIFRDIPFAQPPEGAGRWAAPGRLETPEHLISSKREPVMCPQPQSMAAGSAEGEYLGSEDCLYLDIYAPGEAAASELPVMLWIHGGSNVTGHKGTYDFSRLAAREQVVVVVETTMVIMDSPLTQMVEQINMVDMVEQH